MVPAEGTSERPAERKAERTSGPTADEPAGLVLAPFRAVRYGQQDPHDLGLVTSPPYDVINAAALETLRASHPHNIVRLILPRPGEEVAERLQEWLRDGVLVRDDDPGLYVYEYAGHGRRVRGLVGALGLRDFADRIVLPHEDVMPGPVAGRASLMRSTRSNLEPILLVYDGDGTASDAVDATTDAPPLVTTLAPDGSEHTVWRIDEPATLRAIAADLAPRQALIADGHHRYAAYRQCQQTQPGDAWSYGLAMLVDQSRHPLHLGPIHRVARGLALSSVADTPATAGDLGWTAYGADGAGAHAALDAVTDGNAFLATDGRAWGILHGRLGEVETAALHDLLLPQWGVADDDVLYVHDASNAVSRAVDVGGTALLLRAPDVSAVVAASSRGLMLPRKTTSFGPKPRMGLLLRLLDG
ncbi:MAG: DUF1015 family protein [Propionibacteriales bacterium]|nr:DUF1015 family protein [Propionibacteriales bacterium]